MLLFNAAYAHALKLHIRGMWLIYAGKVRMCKSSLWWLVRKKSQNTKNCFATDFLFETLFTTVHFVLFALFERGQLKNITKSVFQFCRLAKCSGIRLDLAPTVVLMVFEVAACFFLACEDFGRMFGKSFPAWAFFFFFYLVGISSRTLIPLFRPGSVHSGSASWDDCDRVFPDELRVSLFPDRFPPE